MKRSAFVAGQASPVYRWAVLAVVCLSALIINIDNTILNVALPTLVRDLNATSSGLQWIVDSYAMVFAGLLLAGGSLADRFGRRRLFLVGMTIFAVGSIGAAFSGAVDPLVAFRAVMGAGAALTIPASLSIVNDVFRDPARRAVAIGVWAATIGLGTAIGPIAGGLLLDVFWWGSIFLINVPIALVGVAGAIVLVRESRNPNAAAADPGGAILSISGLGLLLWAIIEAPSRGWTSPWVLTLATASLAVLGTFVWWEAHSRHPMLALRLFADRRFSVAATTEVLGGFGLLGALFVQTQFLQSDLNFSPLQAGLRILPLAVVLGVSAPVASILSRMIGVRLTVATGLAVIGCGMLQIALVSEATTTYADTVPGLLLIGLGAGLLLPTATNSVVGAVPQGDSGVGSASNAVALQLGGALGVAVIGSVLATRYQDHMKVALAGQHLPAEVTHTILGSLGGAIAVADHAGGASGAMLADAARAAFMSGVGLSLAVGAAVAFGGVLLAVVGLPARRSRNLPAGGDGPRGQRPPSRFRWPGHPRGCSRPGLRASSIPVAREGRAARRQSLLGWAAQPRLVLPWRSRG